MRVPSFIILFFVLGLGLSCKKVSKKINSEKSFQLFVVDSLNTPVNKCFTRVWGKGKANLNSCSNLTEGFKLPLNIQSDSSVFYFQSESKTDTISFLYSKYYDSNGAEFEVKYTITKIKSTMGKINLKCIKDLTPDCNGDQAYFSAAIYQ